MRVLILGVTGQDGSYLAEQLLGDGHEVWGMVRRAGCHVPGVRVLTGDLLDQASLEQVLRAARPDEVYNLAAVTAPGGGWGTVQPPLLADVTAVGVVRLVEAMLRCAPGARLVHASSSAVYDPHRYGLYGASKLFAHQVVAGARTRLHASNAVLFSHTSPRQDARFLARRVTSTVGRAAAGHTARLTLGDVDSRRDWGYAPDYCRALALIARQDSPGDHVVATGVTHSVRDLAEAALAAAGLAWDDVVDVDHDAPRVPDEMHPDLQPDRLAAWRTLNWKPEIGFMEMVELMVRAATAEARR